MKQVILVIYFLGVSVCFFAQAKSEKNTTVEVHQVIKNGGTVHISVSFSKETYKKRKPDKTFQSEPYGNTISVEIAVPTGDCVINVYQDRNGNGKCDENFLGIPKEPVGISNWDGKGVPGSFDKLKVSITDKTQIIRINLYQL